uniref:Citrate transporter-like domain-containing protein n=1 Tax=Cucumis melo TaxID=3656 RepID=A0A9I9DJV3_CUCME
MASLSIGIHLPPSHHWKRFALQSQSPISLPFHTSYGSSLSRVRTPRLLGKNLLVRAEDENKSSSSFEQLQAPPSFSKQLEELSSKSGTCDPLCSVDEVSSQDFEDSYQPKTDLVKAFAIFAAALTGTVAINHSWVAANQDLAMVLLFSIGYAGIIFEESLAFNKSGVGLLMAVGLWVIRSIGAPSTEIAASELTHATAEVSEIVFFLLGAMTIVEIIDAHQGFKLVTDSITTRKPRTLLWVSCQGCVSTCQLACRLHFNPRQPDDHNYHGFSIAKTSSAIRVSQVRRNPNKTRSRCHQGRHQYRCCHHGKIAPTTSKATDGHNGTTLVVVRAALRPELTSRAASVKVWAHVRYPFVSTLNPISSMLSRLSNCLTLLVGHSTTHCPCPPVTDNRHQNYTDPLQQPYFCGPRINQIHSKYGFEVGESSTQFKSTDLPMLLGAVIVIAANAGGAWTPIGDVTTTMLWIHGQITTMPTLKDLVIPSAVSLAVPLALLSLTSEVNGKGQDFSDVMASEQMAPRGKLVFSVGVGALVFVPVFKALTGLPPYMGMLLGLGILWILTDAIHYGESERQRLKVPQALSRIDTQGALFFLGILLSVSSLEAAGVLRELANYLDAHIPNVELIASAVGVISAIIDNVPLVAATMGMYDLSSFAQDSEFWQLIAFCAGTGGSMLIIGSAAGVAFMGMEKVDFFWYLRKVSGFAFAGYAAGIAAYLALHNFNISLPTTIAEVPSILGS